MIVGKRPQDMLRAEVGPDPPGGRCGRCRVRRGAGEIRIGGAPRTTCTRRGRAGVATVCLPRGARERTLRGTRAKVPAGGERGDGARRGSTPYHGERTMRLRNLLLIGAL